jgi:hypothetical protein
MRRKSECLSSVGDKVFVHQGIRTAVKKIDSDI